MLHSIQDWITNALVKFFGSDNERMLKRIRPIVERINAREEEMRAYSDQKLREKTTEFQDRLQDGETLDDILPAAFATVREAARRAIGLRHFDVQLIGGIALHQGKIIEMITGEGKTLVATAPAYLNALTGKNVHIITVNDYLAQRDRDWMGPVYEMLGLSVGCIQSHMSPQERIQEYRCNITYGTNNEFGFDYLRDNMKMSIEDQCQGELYYAIVDEVDSVLIDEARTPLIISGPAEESTDKYYVADKVVRKLEKGRDFELKEKEQLAVLTEDGIERAERLVGVDSFYKGKNMEWPHHITQALRAHQFFLKDREYVIENNDIVIVDEFTGRLQYGRTWSDGLHQAIEAKERLKIREENQTLATITLQNYFRLYDKLSGMTGTALTEAMEFHKIYKVEVLVVPPNRPLTRIAHDDLIFGTEREKLNAVVDEIVMYHKAGRPLLVGTISIEKSELLSRMLDLRGVKHQVLNAKHHEKEAQIISGAGELGRVTIATNMAGRGTDIVLGKFTHEQLLQHWKENGLAPKKLRIEDNLLQEKLVRYWGKIFLDETDGNRPVDDIQRELNSFWHEREIMPIKLCESVQKLGGLHVLGTERHDARRIDNQLRGRSGRQGDPGSSRFYLCFEDDLLRKFAPPAMIKLMERLGLKDGQPIQHGMISRGIEKAQRRVEGFNFEIRKSLLEYDEVMDEQRKIVYSQRQKVLAGDDLQGIVWEMLEDRILDAIDLYLPAKSSASEWDMEGLSEWAMYKFAAQTSSDALGGDSREQVKRNLLNDARKHYEIKEKSLGTSAMRELERYLLLNAIDSKWKDHLHAMDELKSSIGLRGYGGTDPKIEYKRSGYAMFDQMIVSIKEEVTDLIFKLEFDISDMSYLEDIWQPANFLHNDFDMGDYETVNRDSWENAQSAAGAATVVKTVRDVQKVGRNDPCPCNSGKKFKKCCGRNTA